MMRRLFCPLFFLMFSFCLTRPVAATPPGYVPGTLAKNRLQGFETLLDVATEVQVFGPLAPQNLKGGVFHDQLPDALRPWLLSQMRGLLTDDALYLPELARPRPPQPPDLTLEISRRERAIPSGMLTVSLWLDAAQIEIEGSGTVRNSPTSASEGDARFSVYANPELVFPRLRAFLRHLIPGEPRLRDWTLRPTPPASVSDEIPADVLTRIRTIKVGMTRGQLLRVFAEEGGLTIPPWHTYVYRAKPLPPLLHPESIRPNSPIASITFDNYRFFKSTPPDSGMQCVKINAKFAVRDAEVVWSQGRGVLVDPMSVYKLTFPERANDKIIELSAPYVGLMTFD